MAAYTTIDDPSAYFKVQLYTGTGSSHAVSFNDTDTNMQPDMVWIKQRSDTNDHNLFDAVRGTGKLIRPNGTNAEGDTSEGVKSFDSDGFTCGTNSSLNGSTSTYVAWCWKAGTTSGITTTGANITPSAYSMNATSGISIIKYEGNGTDGTNTAHALGAVPHVIICKRLENSNYWAVYHHKNTSAPNTDYLVLNATDATSDAGLWKDTDPTSVYFRHDNSTSVNANGEDMVAYLFTSIQGFSKFGKYTGNVNADGVFIYLGFKPALFIVKETGNAEPWVMYDNRRGEYGNANPNDQHLVASGTAVESSGTAIDFLSNGVKIRSNAGHLNEGDYIYMAWAETPFVNSNGVPCNAR